MLVAFPKNGRRHVLQGTTRNLSDKNWKESDPISAYLSSTANKNLLLSSGVFMRVLILVVLNHPVVVVGPVMVGRRSTNV